MNRRMFALLLLAAPLMTGCGYNRIQSLTQEVDAAQGNIQTQLQRRADLIPNLVNTVKGYAKHEEDVFTQVTQARAGLVSAVQSKDPVQMANANDQLTGALGRLLVVAEAYPNLKATENFRDLQAQLEGTENRISVERMRYNEAARDFDTARDSFPTSIVAGMFGGRFAEKQFFTAKAGSDVPPKVKF